MLIKMIALYHKWLALVVLGIAISFLTIFQWVLPAQYKEENELSDYARFYKPVGEAIAQGNGLVTPTGEPAVRYPPGFPLVIASLLTVEDHAGIPYATLMTGYLVICGALSTVLMFKMSELLWGIYPALLTALIWLTYPVALWSLKQPNSETIFMVVFLSGFYVFLSAYLRNSETPHWYFLSGVLIGLSMLIRPAALAVGIILFIFLIWQNKTSKWLPRLTIAGSLLLGNILVVTPWQLWLNSKTEELNVLSTGGAPSIVDGLTFAVNDKGYREIITIPMEVKEVQNSILADSDNVKTLPDILSILSEQFGEHPSGVIQLFMLKGARSWYATDSMSLESYLLLIQAVYLVTISIAIVLVWRQKNQTRKAMIPIILLTLYFWGMTILVLSIVRYMLPTMALLFLLIPAIPLKIWELTYKAEKHI